MSLLILPGTMIADVPAVVPRVVGSRSELETDEVSKVKMFDWAGLRGRIGGRGGKACMLIG
jgi:hypothetical protein